MKTGKFPTNNGLNIFYRHWEGIEHDSVILCIHGLASDSRIYDYLAIKSSSLGHNVYAIDLPGYGQSDGEKGDVSFDLTINALHDVVAQISETNHNAKIFMLGFSLGGLLALWYARLHPEKLQGVIGLAPHLRIEGVKRDPRTEPSKEVLEFAIQKYSTNPEEKVHIGMAVPNAFGELAGEEWVHMLKDPLCNFNYSFRYIFDVMIGRAETIDELYKLRLPVLILQGDQDLITVPGQTRTFISRVESQDKELKIFQGSDHWFYHTVFYEQRERYSEAERMKVVNTINEWIREKTVSRETETIRLANQQ
ncbi:MAG: alpha-beta hydrolase superfamily lysophospholipase [Candidatus Nitrosomirales archaeon]|jgi:alpha-beta hydrolase superfamily lysophospholipase